MYDEKIFLTPNEILEKEFKIDARGYRPQEVDKYLDLIIRDYSEFLTIIKRQTSEIKNLESDNEKLKSELRELKSNLDIASTSVASRSITNVDVLKRLSDLEKIVYGNND